MYLFLSFVGIIVATVAGATGTMPLWLAVLSVASINAYVIRRAFFQQGV